jgi:streptomycin 6-kinase
VVSVPSHLLINWADWQLGDVDALAADVLARCEQATRAWGLAELDPIEGGEVALVLAVRTATGAEAVLKLSPRPADQPSSLEGKALMLWAQRGVAPKVIAIRDEGTTLLLERVRPGTSLGESGANAHRVIETIGAVCRRIHVSVDAGAFPTVADHARGDGWLRSLAGTREHDELIALLAPSAGDRLLHVDLHALNVLRGPGGWLAIDPKPCVGDPCADVYGFLDGAPLIELPSSVAAARPWLWARLADLARESGEDPERLAAWLRIRAQILLGEGAGDERESLLRLCEALE